MNTTDYFEKYRDKNGDVLNIGDVVRGNDSRLWKIDSFVFSNTVTHPIFAHRVTEDGKDAGDIRQLKPKWLTKYTPVNYKKWLESVVANFGNIFQMSLTDTEKVAFAKEYLGILSKQVEEA